MHRNRPRKKPGRLQERVAFASRTKLNKHTSNFAYLPTLIINLRLQKRRILSCMDVLLRTRGTIEGGVRSVFDVIREIKCKFKKLLFIVSITTHCHPESCFNHFGTIF